MTPHCPVRAAAGWLAAANVAASPGLSPALDAITAPTGQFLAPFAGSVASADLDLIGAIGPAAGAGADFRHAGVQQALRKQRRGQPRGGLGAMVVLKSRLRMGCQATAGPQAPPSARIKPTVAWYCAALTCKAWRRLRSSLRRASSSSS